MNDTGPITHPPIKVKGNRRLRILVGIIAVLVLIRIVLPYVLLREANDRLAKIPGSYGHIDDLNWR